MWQFGLSVMWYTWDKIHGSTYNKGHLIIFQCVVTQYLFLANVILIMSDMCYSFSVKYQKIVNFFDCSLCFECMLLGQSCK